MSLSLGYGDRSANLSVTTRQISTAAKSTSFPKQSLVSILNCKRVAPSSRIFFPPNGSNHPHPILVIAMPIVVLRVIDHRSIISQGFWISIHLSIIHSLPYRLPECVQSNALPASWPLSNIFARADSNAQLPSETQSFTKINHKGTSYQQSGSSTKRSGSKFDLRCV